MTAVELETGPIRPAIRRVRELDGIRGTAVLLVLLYHGRAYFGNTALVSIARYGWTGVDLFFVLSGFLITGILLESRQNPHYYRRFYARRVARIWPLYLGILAISGLLNLRFRANIPWLWYFLLVQNFKPNEWGFCFLAVTWSLAIEEQFYLFWPTIVKRLPSRFLAALCIATLVAEPIIRAIVLHYPDWHIVNANTFCRLDGLAMGSLLAVRGNRVSRRQAWAAFLVGLVASAILMNPSGYTSHISGFLFSALALCFGGLVALRPGFFRFPLLCWFGTISYGLYLIHFGVIVLGQLAGLSIWWCYAWSIALAAASWRYFERPIQHLVRTVSERQWGGGTGS